MKILTAQQIRELDAFTIEREPITSTDLMERAASAVVDAIVCRWDRSYRVYVFAGPGNNGGDALAVARQLHLLGYEISVYLFNTKGSLSADCAINKERYLALGEVDFWEVKHQFDPPHLDRQALVIDGLFGTGLNKPLDGGYAALVRFINAHKSPVVSIDMPSGLMAEDNSQNKAESIIRATLTLSFQLPKLAFLLAENQMYLGEVKLLDIGLALHDFLPTDAVWQWQEEADVKQLLRHRAAFGHKGTFGHALLVAGSYGMAGAAILAAQACLRSGVGKVSVATPRSNVLPLQISVPEAVLLPDSHDHFVTQAHDAAAFQAIGIGMGLTTERKVAQAFIAQLRRATCPLLIDADGLNILGQHRAWLLDVPAHSILTPHVKEFRRMQDGEGDDYSLLMSASDIAQRLQLYIVLKGHHTAICLPDGRIVFNSTGNSGMATAGSGDVLSGIIVALLAQRYHAAEACRLGVYLHGLAGDLAAADKGEHALTASDLIDYLPAAFQKLKNS